MDNITLVKLIALAFLVVVFVVTVLLMPRILGEASSPEVKGEQATPPPPAETIGKG